MEYIQRQYPLFSACGLNCGLCPRYHTNGISKCPGCAGENFSEKHPACGVLSCCQRHGFEYCYLCDEYPCKKYDGAGEQDSFITHKNQFEDFEKIRKIGIEKYKNELDEKVGLLQILLEDYDDGRRKNFFCIAVNLMELEDIKYVMAQIRKEGRPESSLKEKALIAVSIIQAMADSRSIIIKLRKKQK